MNLLIIVLFIVAYLLSLVVEMVVAYRCLNAVIEMTIVVITVTKLVAFILLVQLTNSNVEISVAFLLQIVAMVILIVETGIVQMK